MSQYFQSDSRHSPKTRKMVSHVWDFDIIITESEYEALVLENSMIKKYKPKYNILLKDDKGLSLHQGHDLQAVSGVFDCVQAAGGRRPLFGSVFEPPACIPRD